MHSPGGAVDVEETDEDTGLRPIGDVINGMLASRFRAPSVKIRTVPTRRQDARIRNRTMSEKNRVVIETFAPLRKVRYAPIVTFATKELHDRWSAVIVDAMQAAQSDALSITDIHESQP